MRYDIMAGIFVLLMLPIWAFPFVEIPIGQKVLLTCAAALSAIIVPLVHPDLRDD